VLDLSQGRERRRLAVRALELDDSLTLNFYTFLPCQKGPAIAGPFLVYLLFFVPPLFGLKGFIHKRTMKIKLIFPNNGYK